MGDGDSGYNLAVDFNGPPWFLLGENAIEKDIVFRVKSTSDPEQRVLLPLFTSPETAKEYTNELDKLILRLVKVQPLQIRSFVACPGFLEQLKLEGVTHVQFDGLPTGIGGALIPFIRIDHAIEVFREMAKQ